MKKILSILLAVLMLVSLFAMSGCSAKELKLGVGVVGQYGKWTEADGETNGTTEVLTTVAAVLLDDAGKIVKCVIDTAQSTATYSSKGAAVAMTDLRTKGEKGKDYGMSAYGTDLNKDGVVKEWNEQIAVFEDAVCGKTIDEVKALVVNGYANEDVQKAGCTMAVADYVTAVEKAVAAAKESKATENDTLKLGMNTTQTTVDATEDKEGSFEIATDITVATLDKDGKVTAAFTDVVAATLKFDTKGVCSTDTTAELKSKYQLGKDYGMAAYGTDLNGDGVVKEWNEQADAFVAELIGKNATEIGGLVKDGYGVESLQTAGCTISVSGMVAAAVKAATV